MRASDVWEGMDLIGTAYGWAPSEIEELELEDFVTWFERGVAKLKRESGAP